jgi:hypothetical protein
LVGLVEDPSNINLGFNMTAIESENILILGLGYEKVYAHSNLTSG